MQFSLWQDINTVTLKTQAPGVERQRSASQSSTGSGGQPANASGGPRMGRRMSMEEYDQPNLRRLSLTGSGTGGSAAAAE